MKGLVLANLHLFKKDRFFLKTSAPRTGGREMWTCGPRGSDRKLKVLVVFLMGKTLRWDEFVGV